MSYYLLNNKLYALGDKSITEIDKNNVKNAGSSIDEEIVVAVVEMETTQITVSDAAQDRVDTIVAGDFKQKAGEGYLLQSEKIRKNIYQVMGIHQDRVREVYSLFGEKKKIKIVPYGVLLRSVLLKNIALPEKQPVMFIDSFDQEILITIFSGQIIGKTRKITSVSSMEVVAAEIKRNEKNYQKQWVGVSGGLTAAFIYVSNSKAVVDHLIEKEHLEPEQVLYFEWDCPVFEGLKENNVNLNYCPPEVLVKKAKNETARKFMVKFSAAGLVILMAFLGNIFLRMMTSQMQSFCFDLKNTNQVLKEELKKIDQTAYRSFLKAEQKRWGSVYVEFMNCVPDEYAVNSLQMLRLKNGVSLEVFLNLRDKEAFYEEILPSNKFKDLVVKDVILDQQPGKLIKVNL
ncbi:MAG: hypothetical protein HQL25_01275 [Candidatus Omnitrophica bacterium]|nr:hypothetical protein [Candidatus Omnitrophota bacterium]